jgi:hypothetical protein
LGSRGGVPKVLLETIDCFMVNNHGKIGGEEVLVHSTYRTVIVRNRANFYHVILLPTYLCTLKSGEYSQYVQ